MQRDSSAHNSDAALNRVALSKKGKVFLRSGINSSHLAPLITEKSFNFLNHLSVLSALEKHCLLFYNIVVFGHLWSYRHCYHKAFLPQTNQRKLPYSVFHKYTAMKPPWGSNTSPSPHRTRCGSNNPCSLIHDSIEDFQIKWLLTDISLGLNHGLTAITHVCSAAIVPFMKRKKSTLHDLWFLSSFYAQ